MIFQQRMKHFFALSTFFNGCALELQNSSDTFSSSYARWLLLPFFLMLFSATPTFQAKP